MIYIVEDDVDIREMQAYALKNSGFDVASFGSGSQFWEAMAARLPELVLLDIMLPDMDGLEILRRLRQDRQTAAIPVIMVTAKTTELDRVRGLDTGADDYISKPFGVMELVSRVKALLRRIYARPDDDGVIIFAGLTLDNNRRRVSYGGNVIELTFKEYELLKFMMQNSGTVLTREQLIDSVWGFDFAGETRTVDMHIKTLRQKLGEAGKLIRTCRNVGYMLGD